MRFLISMQSYSIANIVSIQVFDKFILATTKFETSLFSYDCGKRSIILLLANIFEATFPIQFCVEDPIGRIFVAGENKVAELCYGYSMTCSFFAKIEHPRRVLA